MFPSAEISRDVFFNFGGASGCFKYFILVLAAAAAVFFFREIRSLARFWKRWLPGGETSGKFDRIKFVIANLFYPVRIFSDKSLFISYYFLLTGFSFVLITSSFFFADYYLSSSSDVPFVSGTLYSSFAFISDLGSALLVLGSIILMVRIYRRKNPDLLSRSSGWIIVALCCVGIFADSARIALLGRVHFESAAFISYPLSFLFSFLSDGFLSVIHFLLSWSLLCGVLIFFALSLRLDSGIAVKILGHILRCDPASRKDSKLYALDPSSPDELGRGEHHAAGCSSDLFSSDVSGAQACSGCGICDDYCPAAISETGLSPRAIVESINGNLSASGESSFKISDKALWSCTSCGACSELCPSFIDFNSLISRMKKHATLEEGKMPQDVKENLTNMERCGNVFASCGSSRTAWMKECGAEKINPSHEYLFFAGCRISNGESMAAVRAFFEIARRAGIKIGVLGEEENCCGDFALRSGDDLLFAKRAVANMRLFRKYGVKKIITLCPHGYNVMKKEYKRLAYKLSPRETSDMEYAYSVISHVELIDNLFSEGKLSVRKNASNHVTYHDPCFLGRHNGLYGAPRRILETIAGPFFVNMFNCREKSFCCGFYGKHGDEAVEMSRILAREAHSSGARTVATACPHCASGLSLAIDDLQLSNIEQKDICEIVLESI